jgi:hypothetical protein
LKILEADWLPEALLQILRKKWSTRACGLSDPANSIGWNGTPF